MKIVLVNNFYYLFGGAEKVFLDQISLFRKKGHVVYVYSQAHPSNSVEESEGSFPPHNSGNGRNFFSKIPRFFRFFYSPANRRAFRKFLERIQPDLVHAHNLSGGLTTSVLDGAREAGVPVVLTLHDYKIISPSANLLSGSSPCVDCLEKPGTFRCVIRKCIRGNWGSTFAHYLEFWFNWRFKKYESVKLLIAPSRYLADRFIRAGWDPRGIKVLPNSLNPVNFPLSPKNGKYFLYVGRMSGEKGVEDLLRCFSRRKEELVLAGEGEKLSFYRKLAEKNLNIKFLGHLDWEGLEKRYRDCKAVIVPSIWPENAPLAVLEAMAYGKPVIASRMGGLPELVKDGVTGFLFDSGDGEALGRILDRISSNLALGVEMGRNARNAFEERFTQEEHYKNLLELYDGVLSSRIEPRLDSLRPIANFDRERGK